jgi:hypothetical protein
MCCMIRKDTTPIDNFAFSQTPNRLVKAAIRKGFWRCRRRNVWLRSKRGSDRNLRSLRARCVIRALKKCKGRHRPRGLY